MSQRVTPSRLGERTARIGRAIPAAVIAACAVAGCLTPRTPQSSQPIAESAPAAKTHLGESIAWRVLVGPQARELTILRESVTAERDGELEVLTVEAHDIQETDQTRLVRTGRWDGKLGSGPAGEGVRYERVEGDVRRPIPREEGEAQLARMKALLLPPWPSGSAVEVTRSERSLSFRGLGTLHCTEEHGRFPGREPKDDVSYLEITCPGLPWREGFLSLSHPATGEIIWQREIMDATAPGAFVCPVTLREAQATNRGCGVGVFVNGCSYNGSFCACLPERRCSGVARDPMTEPTSWQCLPPNPPDPCGGIAPP